MSVAGIDRVGRRVAVAYVILLWWCYIAASLRAGGDPSIVDYSEYYYRDLKAKLTESMSVNNCSLNGHGLSFLRPEDNGDFEQEYDMSVELVHPSDVVKSSRGSLGKEKNIDDTKLFLQVSPSLCKSKAWIKFKKGETFRGSRGCADRFVTIDGKRVKILNKKGEYF
jgi:hypothetical protein